MMRPTRLPVLCLPALLALACGDGSGIDAREADSRGGDSQHLAVTPANARAEQTAGASAEMEIIDERIPPGTDLACPRGASVGPIRVQFDCDEVTVHTCKDVSNVVLELADGSRYKVEGLTGHLTTFVAPEAQAIRRVWVKAGSNHSGEGPGYGERFDAPASRCSPLPDSAAPAEEEEAGPQTEHELLI